MNTFECPDCGEVACICPDAAKPRLSKRTDGYFFLVNDQYISMYYHEQGEDEYIDTFKLDEVDQIIAGLQNIKNTQSCLKIQRD